MSDDSTKSNAAGEASDEALLRRLRAGDQDAMQALFLRYQARLAAHTARFLASEDLAHDAVQETFLKLLASPPKRLQNGVLGPWLFRVAKNLALDWTRRGRFEISSGSVWELPWNTDGSHGHGVNPLSQAMASSDGERLRKLRNELPEDLRVVIEDRIDHNLSFQQIADKEGIPLGTALWRVYHALELLRRRWLSES